MEEQCALQRSRSDASSSFGTDQHHQDCSLSGLSPEAVNGRKDEFGLHDELSSARLSVVEDSVDTSESFILPAWTRELEPENVLKNDSGSDQLSEATMPAENALTIPVSPKGSIQVFKREREDDACVYFTPIKNSKRSRGDPGKKQKAELPKSPQTMEKVAGPVKYMKPQEYTSIDDDTEPEETLYREALVHGKLSSDPLEIRLNLSDKLAHQLDPNHLEKQFKVTLIRFDDEDEVQYVTNSGECVTFRPSVKATLERDATRTWLSVSIRKMGRNGDTSKSLPLSSNHTNCKFHFRFEFWIGDSLIETVKSRAVRIYSKQTEKKRYRGHTEGKENRKHSRVVL